MVAEFKVAHRLLHISHFIQITKPVTSIVSRSLSEEEYEKLRRVV